MSSAYRMQGKDLPQIGKSAAQVSQFASSSQPIASAAKPELPSGFRFAIASAGDHVAIRQFLAAAHESSSEDEFLSDLCEPHYEPSDRILIKRGLTIVAHVHTRVRVLRMGKIGLPVGQVCQLAVLPEYGEHGLISSLLQAAELSFRRKQVAWAVMRTKLPGLFRHLGWGSYVPFCLSTAGLRDLLREFTQWPPVPRLTVLAALPCPKIHVRPWRQIELNSLRSLYEAELCEKVNGVWARSEAQWRWLIERRDYDQIYVVTQQPHAIECGEISKRGRPKTEFDVVRPSDVVAYAVQRGDQVLELVARGGNAAFSKPLLARICADGLERGNHELTFYAEPGDPVHVWFNAAGRPTQQLDNLHGRFLMGKVLDFDRFLQLLLPTLSRRIAPTISEKWQLGIHLEDYRVLLKWGQGRLHMVPNATARNYVKMSPQTLLSLVCGQLDAQQPACDGAFKSSTKLTQERVSRLFCRLPFVWPAWDA